MSKWYEVNDEDIDVVIKDSEANLLVHDDYHGNVYAVLTFKQIDEIYAKIHLHKLDTFVEGEVDDVVVNGERRTKKPNPEKGL